MTFLARNQHRNKKDLLERVFYRTSQDDSKTVLKFVSNIFYQQFFSKIKADFSDCIALDALDAHNSSLNVLRMCMA